jgi:hypothetical protein
MRNCDTVWYFHVDFAIQRPAFVLDLDPDDETLAGSDVIHPVFCNSALRLHERLFDAVISGKQSEGLSEEQVSYEDFKQWATSVTPHDDSKDVFPLSFLYSNLLWTGSTVRQRWRFISGNFLWSANIPLRDLSSGPPIEVSGGSMPQRAAEPASLKSDAIAKPASQTEESLKPLSTTLISSKQQEASKRAHPPKPSEGSSSNTGGSSQSKTSIQLAAPEKAVSDWTAPNPKGVLSPHLEFARSVEWGSTPLGPMESWSPEFRQITNLLMNSPFPCSLCWVRSLFLAIDRGGEIRS